MEILTDKKWKELQDVNYQINLNTTYKSDTENYGKSEYWEKNNNFGDCEDYALTKRNKLIELGWNYKNLRMASCWTKPNKQGYHGVLIIITNKGDFVLDNRSNFIETKNSMNYTWHKIQNELGQWCEVE